MIEFPPRECFEYFHTHNIIFLDHGQKHNFKTRSKSSQNSESVQCVRTGSTCEVQTSDVVGSGSGEVPEVNESPEPKLSKYNV